MDYLCYAGRQAGKKEIHPSYSTRQNKNGTKKIKPAKDYLASIDCIKRSRSCALEPSLSLAVHTHIAGTWWRRRHALKF